MFSRLILYELKSYVRNKSVFLWNFLFPFALVTLFFAAFNNLMDTENFSIEPVPVAVTRDADETGSFETFLEGVGVPGTVEDGKLIYDNPDEKILIYVEGSDEEAKQWMEDKLVLGVVENEDVPSFKILESTSVDYKVNLVQTLLNFYHEKRDSVESAIEMAYADGGVPLTEEFFKTVGTVLPEKAYMVEERGLHSGVNVYIMFFFAVLAYVCIMTMNAGIGVVSEVEANQSVVAMRSSVSPYPKNKRFLAKLIPVIGSHILSSCLAYVYMRFVLKIPIGDQYGLILLTLALGTVTTIFIGCALGALLKGSEGAKMGLGIALPLLMGFLSGMMSIQVKYLVDENVPLLSKINPVNRITNALYALGYYPGHDQYWENMFALFIILGMAVLLTIIGLRRSNYESL